jgi:hypothetical protein
MAILNNIAPPPITTAQFQQLESLMQPARVGRMSLRYPPYENLNI